MPVRRSDTPAEADEAAAECEQGVVDVAASFVADEQALEVVQPGEGAFDDPAVAAKSGAVRGLAASDQRLDTALADEATVLVVVVAAVGDHAVGTTARSPRSSAHRRYRGQQRDQLGDVVAVAARDRAGERDPRRVDEQVVLGAGSGSINRARARFGAPFSLARGLSPRPRATTRSHPLRASAKAAPRAAAPRPRHAATHPADASTSPQSRSQARAADASRRSPCATRTRSPATPAGHPAASDRDTETAAPASAAAARIAPTTPPTRSTARQPSAPLPA